MTNVTNKYFADIAIAPGELLLETIESLEMPQIELAERMGMAKKTINEIIKGKAPITPETALKLESVLGAPASFWNNLEVNYQEALARIKAQQEIEDEIEIVKQIPYSEMAKNIWIIKTRDVSEKVRNLRSYFGVASLKQIPKVNAAFRRSEGANVSEYALASWLRQGEIMAREIETEQFNKAKLRKLIPEFRKFTLKDPDEFYDEMVTLCSECGIALTVVKHLPKTYVCGATNWVNKNKAVVELSIRGGRADIFWFTFFHEIAHIIHHNEKEFHIHTTNNDCVEDEADDIAGNWLIPHDKYKDFIESGKYLNRLGIIQFANSIEVHPCIIIGRLQHEKKINYTAYSDLIPIFKATN